MMTGGPATPVPPSVQLSVCLSVQLPVHLSFCALLNWILYSHHRFGIHDADVQRVQQGFKYIRSVSLMSELLRCWEVLY